MGYRPTKVTTHWHNLLHFDYNDITNVMVEGESQYVVLCMRPKERALLLTALNFLADHKARWIGGWPENERTDLIAQTNYSLQNEMACSEDVQSIIDNLAAISLTMTEIRDLVGPPGSEVSTKLQEIKDEIELIRIDMADDSEITDLIDQVEEIMNAGISILGGVVVPLP